MQLRAPGCPGWPEEDLPSLAAVFSCGQLIEELKQKYLILLFDAMYTFIGREQK